MKKMMRFFLYFLAVLLILIVLILGYSYFSTQNQRTGSLQLKGLLGQVVVVRDQWGVPHIMADKSDLDVYFALGYIHAEDRFWQMEMQRRIAAGTLSEVLGKDALDKDIFLRTWGFYRAAQMAWPAFDDRTKKIIEAYTAGVNSFLNTGHLPLQFKLLHYKPTPWTNIDTMTWSKMMAFNLQNLWSKKINNYVLVRQYGKNQLSIIRPAYPHNQPTILSLSDVLKSHLPMQNSTPVVFENKIVADSSTANRLSIINKIADKIKTAMGMKDWQGKGSDNWVVSGRYTDTGMPLLANDPHLQLNSPGVWYLAELKGPSLHVIGATLPGSPLVVIGHNDYIAWGVTNVNPDNQDIYIEPKNAKFMVIHEVIKIKNAPDYVLDVKVSAHGPIISGIGDASKINQLIAIKWPALMPGDTTIQSFVKMNYAKNWDEFKNALKDFVAPSQNFVYADVKGNIGYYLPGKIPLRPQYCDLRLPIEPYQHCEWGKYIPFDQMPHVFNPMKGYIFSANNETMPSHYRYSRYFPNEFPGFRAKRIETLILEMINQQKSISMDDFKKMQMDTENNLWEEIKPILLNTKPLDAPSQKALDLLKTWSGNMSTDSVSASIFGAWYGLLLQAFPPAISDFNTEDDKPLFLVNQIKSDGQYCRVNGARNCDELLSKTLQETTQKLTSLYKTNNLRKWQWGKIHHVFFTEVVVGLAKPIGWIWNREVSAQGGDCTLNMGSYNQNFHVVIAPSYRQIINFKAFNQSLYIAPPGQVDDPWSRYKNNLILLWRDGKYLPMSSDENDWGRVKKLTMAPPLA